MSGRCRAAVNARGPADGRAVEQLRWIAARFGDAAEPGWTAPGDRELREHFTDEFLSHVTPERLIAIFTAAPSELREELVVVASTPFNTWTLIGVLEEKSSRVVEVLLGTVPAVRLLAGKVLGIGLTVFVQAGLAVVVALSIAHATHSDVLHGTTTLSIAATLVWLVLGYAFYSWVYAAAGATVSRQDQVQSLAFPLALPVIFGYIVSLSAATSGNPSLLVHVLAYLPPTAPLAMPALVGLGAVSWWQFAASAVISLACTVGVARVAAGVYRRAILQTGRRVRLREALARN